MVVFELEAGDGHATCEEELTATATMPSRWLKNVGRSILIRDPGTPTPADGRFSRAQVRPASLVTYRSPPANRLGDEMIQPKVGLTNFSSVCTSDVASAGLVSEVATLVHCRPPSVVWKRKTVDPWLVISHPCSASMKSRDNRLPEFGGPVRMS